MIAPIIITMIIAIKNSINHHLSFKITASLSAIIFWIQLCNNIGKLTISTIIITVKNPINHYLSFEIIASLSALIFLIQFDSICKNCFISCILYSFTDPLGAGRFKSLYFLTALFTYGTYVSTMSIKSNLI
jgi:hypothetical protein